MKLPLTLSALALSAQVASAASTMVDFGTDTSAVANATSLGLDSVIQKDEADANGGAFNVTVGTETLNVDLIDSDGSFIERDRGTTFFDDTTTSNILTPYVRDNVLASDDDMDITVGGLTTGHSYVFDFYVVDLYSNNFDTLNTMTIVGDATFGTVGAVSWRNGNASSTTYSSLSTNVISTGSFVAGAASETFTITGSAGAPRGTIQALTISVVPEPGTYALLAGLLGLSHVMVRRRR